MLASEHINNVQNLIDVHGDLDLVVYDNSTDSDHDPEVEYNDDTDPPQIIISIST